MLPSYPFIANFFFLDIEHAYLQKLELEKKNRYSESESEEDYNIETNAAKKYEMNPVIELVEKLFQIPPPKIGMKKKIIIITIMENEEY